MGGAEVCVRAEQRMGARSRARPHRVGVSARDEDVRGGDVRGDVVGDGARDERARDGHVYNADDESHAALPALPADLDKILIGKLNQTEGFQLALAMAKARGQPGAQMRRSLDPISSSSIASVVP